MIFSTTFIFVSHRHQMPLYNPSHFLIRIMQHKWTIISFFSRWWLNEKFSIIRDNHASFLSGWSTSRITSTSFRRIIIISINPVYFIFSEEKYIFVVLCQNYLKHKWIQVLLFPFIVLIFYVERLNNFNSIKWDSWNRPCKIAYWMVMVFVISEWSSR
jgi:hypothetical protein